MDGSLMGPDERLSALAAALGTTVATVTGHTVDATRYTGGKARIEVVLTDHTQVARLSQGRGELFAPASLTLVPGAVLTYDHRDGVRAVIGRIESVSHGARQTRAVATLDATDLAPKIAAGFVTGISVEFVRDADRSVIDGAEAEVRVVTAATLHAASLVRSPAHPSARVVSIYDAADGPVSWSPQARRDRRDRQLAAAGFAPGEYDAMVRRGLEYEVEAAQAALAAEAEQHQRAVTAKAEAAVAIAPMLVARRRAEEAADRDRRATEAREMLAREQRVAATRQRLADERRREADKALWAKVRDDLARPAREAAERDRAEAERIAKFRADPVAQIRARFADDAA